MLRKDFFYHLSNLDRYYEDRSDTISLKKITSKYDSLKSFSEKMKFINERNSIEKQLVGKWNYDTYSGGYNDIRYYYLLSADGSYSWRGSDNGKFGSGKWSVSIEDSLLYITNKKPSNSSIYKLKIITENSLLLQETTSDINIVKWSRGKYNDFN